MKRITFLTVAVAIIILATSCGNAPKPTAEEPQQTEQQPADGSNQTETNAYIKFDGTTLLVDEFVWVSWGDTALMEKYGLSDDDMDDDYNIVNEVKKYEEWKLLPNATFSIVKYLPRVIDGEEYTVPTPVEVSSEEFVVHINQYKDNEYPHPPVLITGSRSGVSRIAEIYIP